MKINLSTLVLSSTALCATAAFAANLARVDVPFSFTAKGQTYAAGAYEVKVDADQNFITLTSEADASRHIMWTSGPTDAAQAPAVVRFDQVGSDYALKNIQFGERVTPRLDPQVTGVSATTSVSGQ